MVFCIACAGISELSQTDLDTKRICRARARARAAQSFLYPKSLPGVGACACGGTLVAGEEQDMSPLKEQDMSPLKKNWDLFFTC